MRALLSVLLIVLGLSLAPPQVQAQGWVDQPFDPAPMSREDIATLQAALAFSGDYYGYTDGIWNQDAQAALEAWVKREEGASRPLYRHLNRLIMRLEDERVKSGWQLFYSETTNTSYLHPFDLLKSVDNKDAVEFLSEDNGFSVMVRFTDQPGMKNIHDWFLSQAVQGSDPYQYSDNQLWITSATIEDDMVAYARSDFYNGSWSTVSIVVWPEYFYHLNLMAASMTLGGSPASLMWTSGGVIDQAGDWHRDISVEHLREAFEASCRRLNVDCFDIYLVHTPPRDILVHEDLFAELDRMVAAGKIRTYGLSLENGDFAIEFVNATAGQAIEIAFSLYSQDSRAGFLDVARERGVGIICKSPMANGQLTDSFVADNPPPDDRRLKALGPERFARRADLFRQARPILTANGRTMGQGALAWLLTFPQVSTVIPGISSMARLLESAGASGMRLTPEQMAALDGIGGGQLVAKRVQ